MLKWFFLFLISFPAQAFTLNQGDVVFVPNPKYSTTAQRKTIAAAGLKMNEVVQSQCFLDWMGKQTVMNETNGRSKEVVIGHLRAITDSVGVKMYYKCMSRSWKCPLPTSAVAYRQPPEKIINLNTAKFNSSQSICRWAATMAHEALGHALGNYGHSSEWSRYREDTVPYLLSGRKPQYGGDVFGACCK